MMSLEIAVEELVASLLTLQPVELKGVALLRQWPPGTDITAIPTEQLTEACLEMVAYMDVCAAKVQALATLSPVVVRNMSCEEFCL